MKVTKWAQSKSIPDVHWMHKAVETGAHVERISHEWWVAHTYGPTKDYGPYATVELAKQACEMLYNTGVIGGEHG